MLTEFARAGRYDLDGAADPLASGDNLLIRGDNLEALRALRPRFDGAIACVYTDPPFNTGAAGGHYEDALEDARWADMMRPRLEALRPLLHPAHGIVFVHIDHRQLAPLKLLLDTVFGRENFVSLVTVKVKDAAGVGQQSLIFDVCEYLLAYARDIRKLRARGAGPGRADEPRPGPVRGYHKAVLDFGAAEPAGTVRRPRMGDVRIFRCRGARIGRFGPRTSAAEYARHFDRLFADYNPGGGSILELRDALPERGLSCIEYVPTKGRGKGAVTQVYFLNRRILSWLKDTATLDPQGRIARAGRLTNLWDIPNASLFGEGGVEFRNGKKPEALVARVLALASRPGDWVLDAFLGSGTTAAVAHKLGRKWIGIESGDQAETHCLPRLRRVVAGDDPTGVTKATGWTGGGSFALVGVLGGFWVFGALGTLFNN